MASGLPRTWFGDGMNILDTPMADLKLVQSQPHRDARGTFTRLFCAQELQPVLGHRQIAPINYSKTSHAGAVRGMHFQYPPHAEMKMVRCLRGRVWDVAVDLRAGSPRFLPDLGRVRPILVCRFADLRVLGL